MNIKTHTLLIAGALFALSAPAAAQGWSDNFDSYANNTALNNVAGWFGWDNVPAVAGTAVNTFARSAPNSLRCVANTDAIHPNTPITSGKWRITAWQYIATGGLTNNVYLIVNNIYNHGGPYQWILNLRFTPGGTPVVTDIDPGRILTPQPIVFDTWVEVRVDIDLGADTLTTYYNGVQVSTGVCTAYGGPKAIQNVDLFSQGGTCYWDDIVLDDIVATQRSSRDIVTFDVNADGKPDLATANFGTNDVSVYVNPGTGIFGSDVRVALTGGDTGATAVAAGDLDGDGQRDDLAVACSTSNTICKIVNPTAVTPTLTSMALGTLVKPTDVAAASLNGNATSDLVVACEGQLFGNNGGLAVSLDGGAVTVIAGPSATAYVRIALGDLDGDGDIDIAAVAHGSPDHVDLFANNGSGVFTPAGSLTLPTNNFATGICCCDIDSVLGNDLVVLVPDPLFLPTPKNEFLVYKNTGAGALGAGRFTAVGPIATPGQFAYDVACGDIEQDTINCPPTVLNSHKDLCIVNAGVGAPVSHHGFNGVAFSTTQFQSAGTSPVACVIADFNGDGCDDLAIANQGSDTISVTLTTPPALAESYGTGCPGTGGLIPLIGTTGLPVSGSATFAVNVTQARSFSSAALLFSGSCADAPLGGGCRVYIGLPVAASVVAFTNGTGVGSVPIPIPVSVALGGDAYLQWAVLDPNGAFSNTLALSAGLRVQIGL